MGYSKAPRRVSVRRKNNVIIGPTGNIVKRAMGTGGGETTRNARYPRRRENCNTGSLLLQPPDAGG